MLLFRFLLLLFSLQPVAIENNADAIPWKADRKLTWADFKAAPDKNSTNAALTNCSIMFGFGYKNDEFSYNIKCLFHKDKSWAQAKNDYILAHEQGHFDIAEIYARKLNKALKEYVFNLATVSRDVNALYEKIIREQMQVQQQYDEETNFSRNAVVQKKWLEQIPKQLSELAAYANYP